MSKISMGSIEGLTINNNVVTVPSGHIIKQAGSQIQVNQTVMSARQTYSSVTVWTDISGLSVDITPKFANSKIMVEVMVHASVSGSTTINFRVLRNGTAIGIGNTGNTGQAGFRLENSNTAWADNAFYKYLDSPATTATQTYKVQVLPYYDGRNVTINNSYNGGAGDDYTVISTITVTEIAQ